MRTYFSTVTSFVINDLKNKAPHPTDFLRTDSQKVSNVRRNPFQHPFSLKINTPFLITQYDIISIIGIFNNFKMPIMPKVPHVIFIFRVRFLWFSVFQGDALAERIKNREEKTILVQLNISINNKNG